MQLDALDQATVGKQGNPTGANQYTESGNGNNVTVSTHDEPVRGNANTYALRKLRKDRPDLHARVIAGEISPHAPLVPCCARRKAGAAPIAPSPVPSPKPSAA